MKGKYLPVILFASVLIGLLTATARASTLPLSATAVYSAEWGNMLTFLSVVTPTPWPTPTESPTPTPSPSPTPTITPSPAPSPSPTVTIVIAELPPTPTPKLSSEQEQLGGLTVLIFVALTLIIALAAAIWAIRSARNRP